MNPCKHRLQEGLGRAISPGKCLQRLDDFLGWVHLWKTDSSPLSPQWHTGLEVFSAARPCGRLLCVHM